MHRPEPIARTAGIVLAGIADQAAHPADDGQGHASGHRRDPVPAADRLAATGRAGRMPADPQADDAPGPGDRHEQHLRELGQDAVDQAAALGPENVLANAPLRSGRKPIKPPLGPAHARIARALPATSRRHSLPAQGKETVDHRAPSAMSRARHDLRSGPGLGQRA
jgi:hypothetical protein